MGSIPFILSVKPKEGCKDEVGAILQRAAGEIRQNEPGCELLLVTWSPSGGAFKLLQVYRSEADLQAHREAKHTAALRSNVQHLIAEPPVLEPLEFVPRA